MLHGLRPKDGHLCIHAFYFFSATHLASKNNTLKAFVEGTPQAVSLTWGPTWCWRSPPCYPRLLRPQLRPASLVPQLLPLGQTTSGSAVALQTTNWPRRCNEQLFRFITMAVAARTVRSMLLRPVPDSVCILFDPTGSQDRQGGGDTHSVCPAHPFGQCSSHKSCHCWQPSGAWGMGREEGVHAVLYVCLFDLQVFACRGALGLTSVATVRESRSCQRQRRSPSSPEHSFLPRIPSLNTSTPSCGQRKVARAFSSSGRL